MWLQYVKLGLERGQQVFRRSVIEKLVEEVEANVGVSPGDNREIVQLKMELAISRKQTWDLQRMLRNAQTIQQKGKQDGPNG